MTELLYFAFKAVNSGIHVLKSSDLIFIHLSCFTLFSFTVIFSNLVNLNIGKLSRAHFTLTLNMTLHVLKGIKAGNSSPKQRNQQIKLLVGGSKRVQKKPSCPDERCMLLCLDTCVCVGEENDIDTGPLSGNGDGISFTVGSAFD